MYKKPQKFTYTITFASSIKSSSDIVPSFMVFTATSNSCLYMPFTTSYKSNKLYGYINTVITSASSKLTYKPVNELSSMLHE